MSTKPLSDDALNTLFRSARSHSYWLDKPVSDDMLHNLYDLMKWGPTSGNCTPARLVFVRSQKAKERLKPCLDSGNVDKSMTAPVVAIIGMDMEFYEKLSQLFPHNLEARSWFAGKPEKIQETAFRNSSLQGAYFILAARSLGLDCGPMSGFDKKKLDAEFFPDGKVMSNFICAIGHADVSRIHPRGPRLDFTEACRVE
ncbi:MAG: malonic semialdehyde reductase [Sulfuricaulis sp.]|uniref:malonic semialdehyde reductase n=1 Tax=Sulfuricaulis sp. TaxID=2003553 RepID=UPI0025D1679F|nr:malonic semialdehyde reductase [Sulfuricaulis sp.]MCR4347490.1 malonic semialdehyde reductase [Sulfuricaulis sp.]